YEVHERSTGARRACKIISKKRVEDLELLERELQVLISLDHPNVIRMLSWYESDNNLYVIMELCEGGELFDVIDKREELYSDHLIGSIIRQIFLGVAYLHQVGIVHRDLKLENCLFKTKDMRSCVKLIDFGLAGLKPMYHDKPWLKDVL
ncbi:Serine/threonine-protein kinase 33, partial [Perkinsus olseni]